MQSLLYRNDLDIIESESVEYLCGIDEAGRGALAGPVVVAAVILDYGIVIENLNDSKKLSPIKRELLYQEISRSAIAYVIIEIDAQTIDTINILKATLSGFTKAYQSITPRPSLTLIDGKDTPTDIANKARAIVKGDNLHACIAAASILAKVHRDRYMTRLSRIHPQYGFDKHKGYGTEFHYSTLNTHGACLEHRRSFRLH